MTTCALPGCESLGDHLNRREQRVCVEHVAVVVGNDAPDGKHDDAGGDY